MDEDDLSSSSSKHYSPSFNRYPSTLTTTSIARQSYYSSEPLNVDFSSSGWVTEILLETARAIAGKNSGKIHHLMWILNELGSPYGDINQKLASYFMQALFIRMTGSGDRTRRALVSTSYKTCSFEPIRKTVLRFQEVSPWTTFGHVACNGAIMEALEGEPKLHIIDISSTFCTQWPTFLEALATRTDDTPHLRLTNVVVDASVASVRATGGGAGIQRVMNEIGHRMEKFARLMRVPFKFNVVNLSGDLSELDLSELDVRNDEALAINFVGSLHSITPAANRRDRAISSFRQLNPKIVTVVEEEADLMNVGIDGPEFVQGFGECVRWFRLYFESLEESFPKTSEERLVLERAAGSAVVGLLAGPPATSGERREPATRWSGRLRAAGFIPSSYSDELCDDVRALLRRYKEGWAMTQSSETAGIFLCWKDRPVVWASAWRPTS
ncbi:hypothetical protein SAY86_025194 [Trapa natans]|uniref:Uncharacterized protein n=1 Tax=Trapa natans TaxID=22666 RepID=A0AAN7M7X4_TRANT|nr:hypothetical protein SAY86_025194 [Trapa natans]